MLPASILVVVLTDLFVNKHHLFEGSTFCYLSEVLDVWQSSNASLTLVSLHFLRKFSINDVLVDTLGKVTC